MNRCIRRLTLIVCILILCAMSASAFAAEMPDIDRKGSISVNMSYEGEKVSGGSLTLYHVADVTLDKGDWGYAFTEVFAASGIALDDIESKDTAGELAVYAANNSIAGDKKNIGDGGEILFAQLPLGLYLFVQEDAADGYKPMNPFLVSVPGMEGGSYVYDVDASPKLALIPEAPPTPTPTPTPSPTPPPQTPPPTLPQTGQTVWPVPVLAFLGACLIVMGVCVKHSGRKKPNEE